MEDRIADPPKEPKCVQKMALKIDWSSLDGLPFYVMNGDDFVINDYGHPSFIRYIEGDRLLTLSYQYVDETARRGRHFFIFKTYVIQVQLPVKLSWDDGKPLTETDSARVLDRICQTVGKKKKRPCTAVVNDELYERLAAIDRQVAERRKS